MLSMNILVLNTRNRTSDRLGHRGTYGDTLPVFFIHILRSKLQNIAYQSRMLVNNILLTFRHTKTS